MGKCSKRKRKVASAKISVSALELFPSICHRCGERREDIPLLVEDFIDRIRLKTDKPLSGISKKKKS
jgi:DNA-binding NtrC family response regulator